MRLSIKLAILKLIVQKIGEITNKTVIPPIFTVIN